MGCLVEFILEIIVEGIFEGWFYLMTLIVPAKMKSQRVRRVFKVIVIIFSVILLLAMFSGLILSGSGEAVRIGRKMFLISLGISIIQILLGILFRCIQKKKEKTK